MGQPGRSDVRSRPPESIGRCEVSGGTETSQYPEEKKSTEIPQVVVSERGGAQTWSVEVGERCGLGVVGSDVGRHRVPLDGAC